MTDEGAEVSTLLLLILLCHCEALIEKEALIQECFSNRARSGAVAIPRKGSARLLLFVVSNYLCRDVTS